MHIPLNRVVHGVKTCRTVIFCSPLEVASSGGYSSFDCCGRAAWTLDIQVIQLLFYHRGQSLQQALTGGNNDCMNDCAFRARCGEAFVKTAPEPHTCKNFPADLALAMCSRRVSRSPAKLSYRRVQRLGAA